MERQIEVWIDQYLVQPVHVALKILILVLLDDRTYPMAVVVQENADNSKSSQHITFRTT